MREWLDDFYNSQTVRDSVLASIGPLFTRYAEQVWRSEGGVGDLPSPFVSGLVAAYVAHHLDSSRIQLQELLTAADPKAAIQERLAEWVETRPAKVAANETFRTANAIALEHLRSSGVTRKVWQSAGKSCPYCSHLNGRVVEIDKNFFEPGDSFHPEGAERSLTFTSNIGHPPVHRGCDCTIVGG